MRRFLVVACLAAATLVPTAAAADSLTFTGLGSGAWVNLSLGGVNETGWAGEIKWLLKTPSDSVGQAITTYCADLFDNAVLPTQLGTFESTDALNSDPSISHGAVANAGSIAAYLVNTDAAGAHASNIQAAGLQIAIWQAMFGTGSFSVLTSTANYAAIMSAAAGYAVPSGSFSSTTGYFDVANGSGTGHGQDQVVVGTPEPSTILLLMLGMAAMFGYRRRLSYVRADA